MTTPFDCALHGAAPRRLDHPQCWPGDAFRAEMIDLHWFAARHIDRRAADGSDQLRLKNRLTVISVVARISTVSGSPTRRKSRVR